MADMSVAKQNAIKQLVEGAPESVLRMLASAFRNVGGPGATLVRESVEAETADRKVRSAVFAPLLPLFSPRTDGVAALTFPGSVLGRLWRETSMRRPELAAQAAAAVAAARYDDPPAPVYDRLCREAAVIVREAPKAICPDRAEELAGCLDLAPLARGATESLRQWTGRPTEDAATALRLLLKDATAIADDGTPRILEILLAHLPDAGMVLRLIALARGGADERLLAGSELAGFGERLLDTLDRRMERVAAFRVSKGPDAALDVAADLAWCAGLIEEFNLTLELDEHALWGRRVIHAREHLNKQMAALLRPCERLVEQALPLERVRIAGSMTRAEPMLTAPTDGPAVTEALAALTLFKAVHKTAQAIGCGGLRAELVEVLTTRILNYADEVIATLNTGETPDEANARALVELAAVFLGLAGSDETARTVRRRVAVAGPSDRSHAGL